MTTEPNQRKRSRARSVSAGTDEAPRVVAASEWRASTTRRALLAVPLALIAARARTTTTSHATELRDVVRERNGRARSFRISWHDPEQAFRSGSDFEGFPSRQTTWCDGSQYLVRMADDQDRPFFYQWMSRDFTIGGPLEAAEAGAGPPRRGKPQRTWPPWPNLLDLLPRPDDSPVELTKATTESGRAAAVLHQGEYRYWIDERSFDVIRLEFTAADHRRVVDFDDFRWVPEGFDLPHRIEIQSVRNGSESNARLEILEAELWSEPRPELFEELDFLDEARELVRSEG